MHTLGNVKPLDLLTRVLRSDMIQFRCSSIFEMDTRNFAAISLRGSLSSTIKVLRTSRSSMRFSRHIPNADPH